MSSALMLATAAALGWMGPAELRRVEPDALLAAAFVARLSIDATRAVEVVSPEAVALELWYPPVPAARISGVVRAPESDPRRDIRYDSALPFFRTRP